MEEFPTESRKLMLATPHGRADRKAFEAAALEELRTLGGRIKSEHE